MTRWSDTLAAADHERRITAVIRVLQEHMKRPVRLDGCFITGWVCLCGETLDGELDEHVAREILAAVDGEA